MALSTFEKETSKIDKLHSTSDATTIIAMLNVLLDAVNGNSVGTVRE
jgi:hypothetical protein